MVRWLSVLSVVAVLLALTTIGDDQPQETASDASATGIVFHDVNGDGIWNDGDKPLAGVRVSNGADIVKTDDNGRYQIPVDNDTVLFVIKPSGFRTPLNEQNLPRFFYVHKPNGSPDLKYGGVEPTGPLPESVDFPLYPQDEPEEFKAILFGDTQPRNQQEVDWIAHDVVEKLIGTDASFGVTLGDIVFDDLNVMEPLNKTIALLGIPWYNVIGNHDINYDAKTRRFANETFERIYGPSYYSFDYGPVHFLVLDDIEWLVNDETGKGRYRGGFGSEQVEFIKRDLQLVPPEQMVVLLMHIPLTQVNDRHDLYRLIEQRPFCISISGHTHHHEHVWITRDDGWNGPEPHHHIINVTVCGSWWGGAPDERGIPHATMADGAPNGYSIMTFDGTDYRLDFFAASRPESYQMEIDAPEVVKLAEAGETTISVNVFNGSEKSVVRMRVGESRWIEMEQVREIDPKYARVYDREGQLLASPDTKELFRQLPKPKASSHLWKAKLPTELSVGTLGIEIEATDHWGRTFTDTRVIRIEP